MKKLIFTLTLLLIVVFANAQTQTFINKIHQWNNNSQGNRYNGTFSVTKSDTKATMNANISEQSFTVQYTYDKHGRKLYNPDGKPISKNIYSPTITKFSGVLNVNYKDNLPSSISYSGIDRIIEGYVLDAPVKSISGQYSDGIASGEWKINGIWLVDTIYRAGPITFEEISKKWESRTREKIPLRTFHNHRKAIEQMFDINIECDKKNGYVYYIENPEDMKRGGVRTWLLNIFTVNNLIK